VYLQGGVGWSVGGPYCLNPGTCWISCEPLKLFSLAVRTLDGHAAFDSRYQVSYDLSDDGNSDHSLSFARTHFFRRRPGEKVIIRRGKTEYVLTRKVGQGSLYGCLRGAIRHDAGKPKVRWKRFREPFTGY